MSLAPEFAPEVFIPERARRSTPPGQRRAQRAGSGRDARALLVAPPRPHRVSQPGRRSAPLGAPVRAVPPAADAPAAAAALSTGWSEPRRVAVAAPAREAVTLILRREAAHPAALTRPAPALHLTRRGAVVRAAAVAALALGLVLVAWLSAPSSTSSAGAAPMPAVVTVEAGDTLWSLATQLAPGSDPREVVSDLRRINDLDSVALQPGQVLRTR